MNSFGRSHDTGAPGRRSEQVSGKAGFADVFPPRCGHQRRQREVPAECGGGLRRGAARRQRREREAVSQIHQVARGKAHADRMCAPGAFVSDDPRKADRGKGSCGCDRGRAGRRQCGADRCDAGIRQYLRFAVSGGEGTGGQWPPLQGAAKDRGEKIQKVYKNAAAGLFWLRGLCYNGMRIFTPFCGTA